MMFVVVWCLALWLVFSVMWSELLMTSAISCPLWSSVCQCQRVECEFTSPVRTGCGLMNVIGTHGGEVMYFGCVCFRGELGFLNCDDICMCVVNKPFELLEFCV